jgi:hypothetical protein
MYSHEYGKKQEKKIGKQEKKQEKRELQHEKAYVSKTAHKAREKREHATERGMQRTREIFGKEEQGLTPAQRSAMQYEAERQIGRGHQAQRRQLLGEQAQRGIVGKGGVAYAQQRDLARGASEQKGQVQRDLDKLNADLALKKQAAIFAGGQGEAALAGQEREQALNELRHRNERKMQKAQLERFSRSFSRV